MNLSLEYLPDAFYILPCLLIARAVDESENDAGWMIIAAWGCLQISVVFDPSDN
jgi:hypothetical protein